MFKIKSTWQLQAMYKHIKHITITVAHPLPRRGNSFSPLAIERLHSLHLLGRVFLEGKGVFGKGVFSFAQVQVGWYSQGKNCKKKKKKNVLGTL